MATITIHGRQVEVENLSCDPMPPTPDQDLRLTFEITDRTSATMFDFLPTDIRFEVGSARYEGVFRVVHMNAERNRTSIAYVGRAQRTASP